MFLQDRPMWEERVWMLQADNFEQLVLGFESGRKKQVAADIYPHSVRKEEAAMAYRLLAR